MYKPLKLTIKRWHCSSNEQNTLQQQSTVNNQNTEDDLLILLRILSITNFTITSLLSLGDLAYYVWTSSNTIRVCFATSCRNLRQSSLRIPGAPPIPYLSNRWLFLRTRWYQLPGAEVSQHRVVTLRRIFLRTGWLTGKLCLPIRRWQTLGEISFGSSCKSGTSGWVLGFDDERKRSQ